MGNLITETEGHYRKLAYDREGLRQPFQTVHENLFASILSWQGHFHHHVATRQEGAIDRLRKVAGGYEQKMRVLFCEHVQLHQYSIGRTMDVDWVGFQTQLCSVSSERLDLIQKHDRRPYGCGLSYRL